MNRWKVFWIMIVIGLAIMAIYAVTLRQPIAAATNEIGSFVCEIAWWHE